jgi:hypothetical protein
MTVYTIYALIGMGLSALFTLIAPLIAAVLFGAQWLCPVALVGVLLFVSFLMWGAMTMQPRRGQ